MPAAALPLLAAGCITRANEQAQVNGALINAGMSAPIARCLSRQLVARLSLRQLRRLRALQGPKRSLADYLAAVDRVNDPQAIEAAINSSALCAAG